MIILQTNNNEKRIDIMIHGDKEMLYDEFFRWHQSKKKLSTTIQFNTKIWNGYIFFLFTTQWKIKNGFYIYSKIYFSMQISTEFLQQIISRCFFPISLSLCLFVYFCPCCHIKLKTNYIIQKHAGSRQNCDHQLALYYTFHRSSSHNTNGELILFNSGYTLNWMSSNFLPNYQRLFCFTLF